MKSIYNIRYSLFILLFTHPFLYKAQDIIVKTDSSRIQSTVLEVNSAELTYKLFNYNEGPTIILKKEEIAYVIYKNGVRDIITKSINQPKVYNPNQYNLDKELLPQLPTVTRKKKNYEKLYLHKNYFGFNYTSFLNSCLAFNYMRDFKSERLILNVPFGFGLGNPGMTNSMYRGEYLGGNQADAHYTLLKYQGGINLLFAPSMDYGMNFLIGPSFQYTAFNVEVNTKYKVPSAGSNQFDSHNFKNTFELRRQVYGISIGFLARMGERINMNALLTLGVKNDTYSEKDPFGHDYIKSQGAYNYYGSMEYNAMPYAGFNCSVGYRF